MELNLKLKLTNAHDAIVNFDAEILHSDADRIVVAIEKEEALKNIQIGTRFIIGELYPRAYSVDGINEYDDDLIDHVIYTLYLTTMSMNDDLVNKIAYNDMD